MRAGGLTGRGGESRQAQKQHCHCAHPMRVPRPPAPAAAKPPPTAEGSDPDELRSGPGMETPAAADPAQRIDTGQVCRLDLRVVHRLGELLCEPHPPHHRHRVGVRRARDEFHKRLP